MANRRKKDPWRVEGRALPPALARAFPAFIDPEDKIVRRRGPAEERRDVEGPPRSVSVDWRTSGAVPPPRSQEQCNACTSFAIVTAIDGIVRAGLRRDGAPK